VATGVKRARGDKFVFTYQGDGDLASIGMAEIMHAANRGERLTVVFVNNTVYGMTGGQMAPTTLIGQKTTTCPGGRCQEREGAPIKMAELISQLGGVAFCARGDKFVFTYQGDGDLASIGMAEIMHAANRGERLTVVFVNNTVYGMTGGQMAPTTLIGQKTTTCPGGRCKDREGAPIRMSEIIAQLGGVAYCARGSLDSVKNIRQAKKYMRRAFEVQTAGLGFGFVELLSGCPTNWRMMPLAANKRITDEMIPYFPLGVYKDLGADGTCGSMAGGE
jgi:pyruvate/2-oxoacid:ferredoxin oxidoreductase beta subunit